MSRGLGLKPGNALLYEYCAILAGATVWYLLPFSFARTRIQNDHINYGDSLQRMT